MFDKYPTIAKYYKVSYRPYPIGVTTEGKSTLYVDSILTKIMLENNLIIFEFDSSYHSHPYIRNNPSSKTHTTKTSISVAEIIDKEIREEDQPKIEHDLKMLFYEHSSTLFRFSPGSFEPIIFKSQNKSETLHFVVCLDDKALDKAIKSFSGISQRYRGEWSTHITCYLFVNSQSKAEYIKKKGIPADYIITYSCGNNLEKAEKQINKVFPFNLITRYEMHVINP